MASLATLRNSSHFLIALCSLALASQAQSELAPLELLVSVADQKLMVVSDGAWVKKYKVSTSRFGVGDNYGSYKTPLGRMRIYEKLGDNLVAGAVFKHRHATGEVLPINAPGRDPIVSRILWLEGLEAQNDNARGRGIYIHGTPEESRIGKPVSYGCIRMRSADVMELYDLLPPGTTVEISEAALPRLPKWKPAPPPPALILAAKTPAVPAAKTELATKIATEPKRLITVATPEKAFPKTPENKVRQANPPSASATIALVKRDPMPEKSGVSAVNGMETTANSNAFTAFGGSILMSGLSVDQNDQPAPSSLDSRGPTLARTATIVPTFNLVNAPLNVSPVEASESEAEPIAAAARPTFRHTSPPVVEPLLQNLLGSHSSAALP